MNDTFYKLCMLQKFLTETQQHRQTLLTELVDNATDPVIKKRRFRMLSNLSTFEAVVIKKISEFETDDVNDLIESTIELTIFKNELTMLLDRSA
jgi:hypothetical protein